MVSAAVDVGLCVIAAEPPVKVGCRAQYDGPLRPKPRQSHPARH